MKRTKGGDFIPAVLIDARGSHMTDVVGSLISVIRQTKIPPTIKLLCNYKTEIHVPTLQDMVNTSDGTVINISFEMDTCAFITFDQTKDNVDLSLLRSIKSFRTIVGTHKATKRPKKFKFTHVISLVAGHKFMANNVVERLCESWRNDVFYDTMLFKMRYGTPKRKSCVFFLPSIRALCRSHLWRPLIERHAIFTKTKPDRDLDFIPIRHCSFGIMDIV